VPIAAGVTAAGEYAVVRHQGDARAYNYLFASSSDGCVYFAGPHTNFAAHHFDAAGPVPVGSLFGNPLTRKL
jgi:hypothetical protein